MDHYGTYFDRRYLPRALALYRSLRRKSGPFRLHALCLDAETYSYLAGAKLPDIVPVSLGELEAADPALPAARAGRTDHEYYMTCGPSFLLRVMERERCPVLTYLDADLYFFDDPAAALADLGGRSILVASHRHANGWEHLLEPNGRYNVGFQMFRRDAQGLACLAWWRERCLEWCYLRTEPGRFADQKYLDRWPELFPGAVAESNHPGVNVAPWNIGRYYLRRIEGRLCVDEDSLIFFHFAGVKQYGPRLFDASLGYLPRAAAATVRRWIYAPYIRELAGIHAELVAAGLTPPPNAVPKKLTALLRGNLMRADSKRVRTLHVEPAGRWLISLKDALQRNLR